MARRLRFNGTGSGVNGCPSIHEDLDTGEVIVHGPALTDPDDVAQLRHLNKGEVQIVVPRELLVDFTKEVARVPNIIGLDEFDQLFTQFEHTAWRLETRRRYASDELTDTYAQFTRSEPESTGRASTPSGVPSAASRPGSASSSSVSASSTTRRRLASSICSTTRAATASSQDPQSPACGCPPAEPARRRLLDLRLAAGRAA